MTPESEVLATIEGVEVNLSLAGGAGTPSGEWKSATATAPSSPEATVHEPLPVSSTPLLFGPDAFVSYIAGADGEFDQQAGGHPSEMATRIDTKNVVKIGPQGVLRLSSVHHVKDVVVDLPMGLLGDAQATPKCTFAELGSFKHCPVGHAGRADRDRARRHRVAVYRDLQHGARAWCRRGVRVL